MSIGRQSTETRDRIAALGRVLGPDMLGAVQDLFRAEQESFVAEQSPAAVDLAYGEHPRQRIDLYRPADATGPAPVLLWVHGGGFLRGEKSAPDHPYNAHVGRWAARNGMIGAVMNYRLVPDAAWPSGGEDVALAAGWLHDHVAQHGGDPARIVLAGTSAGSAHIATALKLSRAMPGVRGAILLSGLYGFTPLDERDTLYYGPQDRYADRMPRDTVIESDVPLFLACAEFDPPRFQAETLALLQAILAAKGQLPRAAIVSGHNHFSLACHIGGSDERLASELLGFIRDVCSAG